MGENRLRHKWPSTTAVIPVDFKGVPVEILEAAAARGTEVHNAAALYAQGLFVPRFSLPDREGYFESFKAWFNQYVKEVICVEAEFISTDFNYVSHIDLVCRLTDYRRVVVDYKTPAIVSKTWRLQLASYRHVFIEELKRGGATDLQVDCMSLRLMKDGKKAKALYYDEKLQDFPVFLSCLNVYRFFNS